MSACYISPADTAKLVRKALKASFPSTTFAVRTKVYSGGASISVSWTDGPLTEQVEHVAGQFAGASFDGMTDMKTYHTDYLVGENTIKAIRYGADFVFCTRHISKQLGERALRYVRAQCGNDWPEEVAVQESVCGGCYLVGARTFRPFNGVEYLDQVWAKTAHMMTESGCIMRLHHR